MTRYEDEYQPAKRGWSPGVVALIATLILALGIGGAYLGIRLSSDDGDVGNPTVTSGAPTPPSDPPTTAPTDPTTAPASSPPTAPTTVAGGFALPNVVGTDFRAARTQYRQLSLGVNVVFTGENATDHTVSRTNPPAETVVTKGRTITLYVPGTAAETTVPKLIGVDCTLVARVLGDSGLFPEYVTGRSGLVNQQDPTDTPSSPVHWNDKVKVWCA